MNTGDASDAYLAPPTRERRKIVALEIALNLLVFFLIVYIAFSAAHRPLEFDDAYMFQRYAIHFRQGLGISWNPDGIHSGGMTSMGWFPVVLLLSYLPLHEGGNLALGSCLTGLAGLVLLAVFVSRLAKSSLLRRFWLVLPLAILAPVAAISFRSNMKTGMDTMLSFTMDAWLSCTIWGWLRSSGYEKKWPMLVGVAGACAVLARPENGLLAVLAPMLGALLLGEGRRWRELAVVALTLAVILAAYEAWYFSYFHAAFPLSFYMKSQHPYRGYIGGWRWRQGKFLLQFAALAAPILAFPLLTLSRRTLRIGLVYFLPIAVTFVYLGTVMQIMGLDARYYMPFAAPLLVAAFWMSDEALEAGWRDRTWGMARLLTVAAAAIIFCSVVAGRWLESWSSHPHTVGGYSVPRLMTAARQTLPEKPWFQMITTMANDIVKPLPPGSVIAASEVGLIGAAAPRVSIIDLAGLNNRDIALHGFNMERLLDRKPLLIWFPHSDYTWQRKEMFCSPRLLDEYTVLSGGAFNYGLAIRKGNSDTAGLEQTVAAVFAELYPGADVKDYAVTAIDRSNACEAGER